MSYLLIHGDARRLPIDPKSIDAVVMDPPYGMNWDPNSRRFAGGIHGGKRYGGNGDRGMGREWEPIKGDLQPFDPSPWIDFPKAILFGANHFARRLPVGTTLVWVKREPHLYGSFLSDAEIAWMKGGYGVYCFEKQFPPPSRMSEAAGKCAHPTQKPISLMRWCIQKLKLERDSLILDPYMGSGTTALAALLEGHRFIGIDIEAKYVAIAKRRIERPHAPIPRPGKPESYPLFGDSA